MRILLVDDDPIFLALLTVSLSELGYDDVVTSTSGFEAMERLKEPDDIDVFLLDVDMEGMDGIELCRKIRKSRRYRDAVIIMVTARRDRPTINAAFRLGASGYLAKPINLKALDTCLEDAAIIRNRNVIMSEARAEVDAPVGQQGLAELSPYNQTEFRNIQNVISFPAMTNYLSSISHKMILESMSLQFQVPEYRQLRETMEEADVHPILADAAEAISTALGAVDPMITYTGGGRFVAVMARNASRNILDKARLANEVLQKIQADLNGGADVPISIEVSEPYVPRDQPTLDRHCLLTGAAAQNVIR